MGSFRELYPPPWDVERMPGGYAVKDSRGHVLLRIYALTDEQRALTATYTTLNWTHAYTLAKAIAKLAERE